jgi:hypothetical protein
MSAYTEGPNVVWPFADRWDRALTFQQFVDASSAHHALWVGVHRLARVPQWVIGAASGLPGRYRLLVLAEDWCGDASNIVPVLAKFTELVGNVELRILRRDEHPEVMDRYLTGSARSIPIVVVLNERMEELGSWGPRPHALQHWVGEQLSKGRDKKELYPEVRRWYAKDKGETTLHELMEIMAREPAPVG